MSDETHGLQKQFGTDGVHPNLMGYLKMKSILEPFLKS
jgi:lysophospholipase L1-like esterase